MDIFLNLPIIIFIVLESLNVLILYFAPDFKYGNAISVFDGWRKAKENENDELFVRYLINWVGNSKLIFIALLLVIVLFASSEAKITTICVLIVTIPMYFVRLHPLIKKLDENGHITPKNYSKTLKITIILFMLMFVACLAGYFFL